MYGTKRVPREGNCPQRSWLGLGALWCSGLRLTKRFKEPATTTVTVPARFTKYVPTGQRPQYHANWPLECREGYHFTAATHAHTGRGKVRPHPYPPPPPMEVANLRCSAIKSEFLAMEQPVGTRIQGIAVVHKTKFLGVLGGEVQEGEDDDKSMNKIRFKCKKLGSLGVWIYISTPSWIYIQAHLLRKDVPPNLLGSSLSSCRVEICG